MYVRVYEGLGQPPEKREPDFVRIILIDPAGILKDRRKLREDFRSQLENKFNNLDPDWLKQANLRFRVQYRSNEPSNEEKARFRNLEFPVYLLGKEHGYKTIFKFMTQHKIPKTIKKQDLFDIAKMCWDARDTWGCGIPSGEGTRKVRFIKTHRVLEVATGDLWQGLVNATAHEIGHMGNRQKHSEKGLMRYPVPPRTSISISTAATNTCSSVTFSG